jgi:UDP-glucose 4-epimerase
MSGSQPLSSSQRVLVTGASGFVGRALVSRLLASNDFEVVAQFRSSASAQKSQGNTVVTPAINSETDWSSALAGVNAVVHCAARVHVMNETTADPLAAFREVNVEGTLKLAREAARSGVRRFIYLSSIKVNGEGTDGKAFTAEDDCGPTDPYGLSKWEAEKGLMELAQRSAMDVVIVRPPLIYGPGVKANFLKMIQWVDRGVPLPLALVDNRRSLVGLENLTNFLIHCIDHPGAANQVFLISDGEDLSTPALLRNVAQALGKPSRLLPFPVTLLRGFAELLGKRAVVDRLCGSLRVDIEKNSRVLGWTPRSSVAEELKRTVKAYREQEPR